MVNAVRPAEPPLRLTRRGRAVVLVLLVLLASMASAVLFTSASRADNASRAQDVSPVSRAPRADSPSAAAARTVVVQPGDTLWDIAARSLPRRDGQAAVAELRRLNALSDYGILPGQVLILPTGR